MSGMEGQDGMGWNAVKALRGQSLRVWAAAMPLHEQGACRGRPCLCERGWGALCATHWVSTVGIGHLTRPRVMYAA